MLALERNIDKYMDHDKFRQDRIPTPMKPVAAPVITVILAIMAY